jgi:ubiquinone/menaquinone biosynthesis C-methylase UbiE
MEIADVDVDRQTEQFWNAEGIVNYFGTQAPEDHIVEFLLEHPAAEGAAGLDHGCGGGRHTELLAKFGYDTYAMDTSPAMIEATDRRIASAGLEADVRFGTILDVPFEDNSFDVVVSTGVLHQARSHEEYDRSVGELRRVMKAGGYLLTNVFTNAVKDPNYSYPDPKIPELALTKEGLLMMLLSRERYIGLMVSRGFELVADQGEEVYGENTGTRAVLRACFQKVPDIWK